MSFLLLNLTSESVRSGPVRVLTRAEIEVDKDAEKPKTTEPVDVSDVDRLIVAAASQELAAKRSRSRRALPRNKQHKSVTPVSVSEVEDVRSVG